ncbi:MAG: hypothetical protein J0H15_11665 [Xanthomonadales bacterium]|nr:hypothetical protein [Xanthomonadales bacterium]
METPGKYKPGEPHCADPAEPAARARGERSDGDAADPDQPIPPDPGKVTDFELDDELCEGG